MGKARHHREDKKAGQSAPAYPVSHIGHICLVVGQNSSWMADVEAALQVLDHVDFCTVDDATNLIHPNHIATVHALQLDHFVGKLDPHRLSLLQPVAHIPATSHSYDTLAYEWTMDIHSGSIMFAAMTMLSIGYDQVILCGCPMSDAAADELLAIKELLPAAVRIRSMSGFTQTIFGGI